MKTISKEILLARQKIYKAKPESQAKRREYDRIRLLNPEVRARMRAYQLSPRGKDAAKKASAKLRKTEGYKIKMRAYKRSEKYRNQRRNFLYKKNFGITLDEYNVLLNKQNGVCAICGRKENFMNRGTLYSLAIDHDHITNEVRGLLCRDCNVMLGLAKDNTETLKNAIQYLQKDV